MQLSKALSLAQSNDVLVASDVVYGGVLIVTNLGPSFVAGDSFTLYNAPNSSGAFSTLVLPTLSGLWWSNTFAANGPGILSVVSSTPILLWTNPSPITFGTALSAIQLNATANVPGSFVYAPPTGTLLPAGSNQLSVTFTPNDTVDYFTVTTNVSIMVNPLPVILTGTRAYDGTSNAAAAILSVANQVPGYVVTVASGSATLAGTNFGPEAITSVGTLALGGVAAVDYTLAGAIGTVIITPPPFSITSEYIDSTGTNLVLVWQSIPGVVYQVQSSTNLLTWTNMGSPITANAILTTNIVPITKVSAMFFRIVTGTASNPQFSITSASLDITGTNFVVCWESSPSAVYTVMTNTSLAAPASWTSVGGPIIATSTTTCFTLPGGIVGQTNVFVEIKQY
jgi:hypothetical protein